MNDKYKVKITSKYFKKSTNLEYYELEEFAKDVIKTYTKTVIGRKKYQRCCATFNEPFHPEVDFLLYQLGYQLDAPFLQKDKIGHIDNNYYYGYYQNEADKFHKSNILMVEGNHPYIEHIPYKQLKEERSIYIMYGILMPSGDILGWQIDHYIDNKGNEQELRHGPVAGRILHQRLTTSKKDCDKYLDFMNQQGENFNSSQLYLFQQQYESLYPSIDKRLSSTGFTFHNRSTEEQKTLKKYIDIPKTED